MVLEPRGSGRVESSRHESLKSKKVVDNTVKTGKIPEILRNQCFSNKFHARKKTMKKGIFAGVVLFTLPNFSALIFGSELMSTADAFNAGGWQISAYGQIVENEPVIDNRSSGVVEIPDGAGGTLTVFNRTNSEIEMETSYDSIIGALAFRPRHGLHYRLKFGQVNDYDLEYASGSLTNKLSSLSSGFLWGGGVRWNVTQDTLVTPAVAFDFSYTQTLIDIDRFESGATVVGVNQKVEHEEFQFAVNASNRFRQLEPFGGFKVRRLVTKLKDKSSKTKVRGAQDGISPFLGLAWSMFEKESLLVEVSFVDEVSVSGGINVRF